MRLGPWPTRHTARWTWKLPKAAVHTDGMPKWGPTSTAAWKLLEEETANGAATSEQVSETPRGTPACEFDQVGLISNCPAMWRNVRTGFFTGPWAASWSTFQAALIESQGDGVLGQPL